MALAPLGADSGLPPVPLVKGPLHLNVVYPGPTDLVDAGDSSFIFGSTGTGEATLSINGAPVRVWPNGAWLAWLAFPPDSVMRFALEARAPGDSASLVYEAHRARRRETPSGLWLDTLSIVPRGRVWWPREEYLPVTVRAAEGAEVHIRLPDGGVVPLVPDVRPEDVPWGVRAFDHDTINLLQPRRADRYAGVIRGMALGADPGPVLGDSTSPGAAGCPGMQRAPPCMAGRVLPEPLIEVVSGSDTVRGRWPIQLALLDTLPLAAELDDDREQTGKTDSLSVGRARPGGTYHWFFPTGTRATVSGRLGDDLRLRLSRQSEAWIPAADAWPLPAGTPPVRATVGSATLTPLADRLSLRVPLSQRVPFRVEEGFHSLTLRLYSVVSDLNWLRYGGTDPYLARMSWLQASADEVTLTLDFAGPVWGYRTRFSSNDLILEIRRPPTVDPDHPLAGRLIVVDPGHPPAGAIGPTGWREQDANLAVALALRTLLQQGGARVIMTRETDTSIDLLPRVKLADSVGADILISVHNNALPDGINPFTNNGTSVFYNHPRSVPLAYAIQRELVHRLGLKDLGFGRGDLALVRPTWMPAVLTEGMFMMLPDQEAALRSPEGQGRYARAVYEGIREFLVAAGRGQL